MKINTKIGLYGASCALLGMSVGYLLAENKYCHEQTALLSELYSIVLDTLKPRPYRSYSEFKSCGKKDGDDK